MLRLLDVQPGHRVLEVGTGSGYSTALLAHLDGRTNVTVLHADGRLGHPPGAPYDRLVAWAQAPQAIP
jgi:protein-L-isoaspartate(D-aspartate) O-methyltransferase